MTIPRIDRPIPGFYRTKLVKGGPWVPARIWWSVATDPVTGEVLDRSPVLLAEVGGRERDPYEVWPSLVGQPIDEREFYFLTAESGWARQHAPDDPVANPRTPINLRTAPPPF